MDFNQACDRLFKVEGFYSENKADLGGATKYGITLQSWAAFTKRSVTSKDVMMIQDHDAREFYRQVFWIPFRCDEIHNETLRYAIFDQAVNRGPGSIVRQIQKILNLKVDGIFGDKTLSAINEQPAGFVLAFIFSCQISYCQIVQKNPSQLVFLVGWINRTQELINLSIGG